MKATLITQFKDISPTGEIIEMVIWRVPQPVPPTTHGYKYRLVYNKMVLWVYVNLRAKLGGM